MSRWTHVICVQCWNAKNPDRPARETGVGYDENCCYCGVATNDGIYIRDAPSNTACKGEHKEDKSDV